jgi:hypothetical protein
MCVCVCVCVRARGTHVCVHAYICVHVWLLCEANRMYACIVTCHFVHVKILGLSEEEASNHPGGEQQAVRHKYRSLGHVVHPEAGGEGVAGAKEAFAHVMSAMRFMGPQLQRAT